MANHFRPCDRFFFFLKRETEIDFLMSLKHLHLINRDMRISQVLFFFCLPEHPNDFLCTQNGTKIVTIFQDDNGCLFDVNKSDAYWIKIDDSLTIK